MKVYPISGGIICACLIGCAGPPAVAGIDHVGIGSDLRGMSSYSEGFGENANFHAIAASLLDAGYTDEEVGQIMGRNFFRVWQEAVAGAAIVARAS